MKFFRQKSSEQRRLSLTVYGFSTKTVDSVEEVVKKLRQALSKTQTNDTYHTIDDSNHRNKRLSIDKSDKNVNTISNTSNTNGSNAETFNESHIKQYLENLRQNIILNKLYSDNCLTEVSEQSTNENQNNNNNQKLFSSFTEELFASDIILELILKLPLIGFENKKLVQTIVCNALLLKIEDRLVTVEYICKEPEILFSLIDTYKYGRSDLTFNCGRILRQCVKHQSLARIAINSQKFTEFFSYVNQQTFDVAMDAFITFRTLLTTHKELSEEYLTQNCDLFFDNYIDLINSDNYVTKRQSLEILALIMSDSSTIRQLFCRQSRRLSLILELFWHHYRHIRFRALNIFNVLISSEKESDHSMAIMQFLIQQEDRHRIVSVLKNFRDCKTKCKFFLDLKPFAAKLIHFFEETTNITTNIIQ